MVTSSKLKIIESSSFMGSLDKELLLFTLLRLILLLHDLLPASVIPASVSAIGYRLH